MLDIFRVPDSIGDGELENNPAILDWERQFIGSLDLVEHRSLSCVFQNPQGFDLHPFYDTRLLSHQVRLMLDICRECQASLERKGNLGNTVYKKLMAILEKAVEQGHGILALGD